MTDRGMPAELWAHYIQQVNTAQRIAVEDSVLLVFSLKNFIHTLKAPKSFPKGRTRCGFGMWYLESWSIGRMTVVCRGCKGPAVCWRKSCLSPSSHPCRWRVVESWAPGGRQPRLPPLAHRALWDAPHGSWRCSLQSPHETFHKGTRLVFFGRILPLKVLQAVFVLTVLNENESRLLTVKSMW